jgi:sulfate transport system substrate-binding protein
VPASPESQSAIGYFHLLSRRTCVPTHPHRRRTRPRGPGRRGCGGSSDSSGDSATASSSGGGRARTCRSSPTPPGGRLRRDHPAFRRPQAGAGVSFKESFGASGEQSRAVEAGLPADVVSFSLGARPHPPGRRRPGEQGLVGHALQGLVTKSVVAFIVRKGNPKHIKTWDDLLKPGSRSSRPTRSRRARRSGTSWRPTAPRACRTSRSSSPSTSRCRTSRARGAAELRLGHGRRAPVLRVRGRRRRARRARTSTTSSRTTRSSSRTDRGDDEGAVAGRRRSWTTSCPSRPRRSSPSGATGRWTSRSSTSTRASSRRRRSCGRSATSAAGAKVNDELFDPEKGSIAKIEQSAGVSTDK